MYCTSNTMFNPHSAKERIKNHLAYKLGLALIEYDKQRKGISQENFNSKESQNNKTNSPFSFKPQETLNHSIPVRGGGVFYSYLDSFSPFLFLKLLFTLLKLKQSHKQQQRFYKQTIQIFPSLKYPPLQSCKDYQESLSYQYHLAYLLGEVLSKADKFWYKGGYLKLNQEIKKAKQLYKIHQEYKEKLQELNLSYCFIPREYLLDSLFLLKEIKALMHKLKSQENNSLKIESFFSNLFSQIPFSTQTPFLVKHKQEILDWLNSKEFKEQYIKTNHPYPPLLNPDRLNAKREFKEKNNHNKETELRMKERESKECNVESQRENRDSIQPYPNLSYESIPAELAWDLNLPLPRGYGFVWLSIHGCGAGATLRFFAECQIRINHRFTTNKETYLINYKNMVGGNDYCAIWTRAYRWENDKLYYLITHNVPLLCVVRDPISLLKPFVNHLNNRACCASVYRRINLTYDYETIMPSLIYSKGERPQVELLQRYSDGNHNLLGKKIALLRQNGLNDVRYLPFSSISLENGFNTFCTLARQLGFHSPLNREVFEVKANGNDRHVYFPFSLFLHDEDIKSMYQLGGMVCTSKDSLNDSKSIEIIVTLKNDRLFFDNQDYKNLTRKVFGNRNYQLPYEVALYVKSDININDELFEAFKVYMLGYMKTLEKKEIEELKLKLNERDILNYFKENDAIRKDYKKLFDEDYWHIKSHRPDIVESWKYYQEFERMCKELD